MSLNEPGSPLIDALKQALGLKGWRAGADMDGYLTEPRGLFQGKAALVARPVTTEQVATVLRLCHAARVGVVPWGGGTGLVGGQVKPEGVTPIVLSLDRMKAIRATAPDENALVAEAGVSLLEAQQAAERVNRLFPLSLASEGSCTIGGVMATNAGGVQVLRYGNARDLCLGLEVVTAAGEVWKGLSTLRKDNTGPDLRNLFIGSEGMLGIITAASLRLFPRPRGVASGFIGVPDPGAAVQLLHRVQDVSNGAAAVFELMPRLGLEFVLARDSAQRDPLEAPHPWYVWTELWGGDAEGLQNQMEAALASALEAGEATDAVMAQSDAQRAAFRAIRETLPEAQKPQGGSIKHDISLPISRIPEFLRTAGAAIEQAIPGARPCPFGHLGDGNLHYNITQPVGSDKVAFLAEWTRINRIVHDLVAGMDGSISAEHGVGRLKGAELDRYADPTKRRMQNAIKAALDPLGILNPGVLSNR